MERLLTDEELNECYCPEDKCFDITSICRYQAQVTRKAIGIEIEEKYCKIAVNRLRQQSMVLEC